jgi:hypothetical protein
MNMKKINTRTSETHWSLNLINIKLMAKIKAYTRIPVKHLNGLMFKKEIKSLKN